MGSFSRSTSTSTSTRHGLTIEDLDHIPFPSSSVIRVLLLSVFEGPEERLFNLSISFVLTLGTSGGSVQRASQAFFVAEAGPKKKCLMRLGSISRRRRQSCEDLQRMIAVPTEPFTHRQQPPTSLTERASPPERTSYPRGPAIATFHGLWFLRLAARSCTAGRLCLIYSLKGSGSSGASTRRFSILVKPFCENIEPCFRVLPLIVKREIGSTLDGRGQPKSVVGVRLSTPASQPHFLNLHKTPHITG